MLLPLTVTPGVSFVSLQTGSARSQIAGGVHDPMGAVRDFADTAAIIANLDAVISVDTAAAHLAGAMGKPIFLLDRYDNSWRWLYGRGDSPWYPTLMIFRQTQPGDWLGPVTQAAQTLEEFFPEG
jgi:ADP-heptose:LPS heptosyltransferase